jgi:hypothetical protein
MLGDEVILKRFFRSDLKGIVIYIPGSSPKHPDFEYEGIGQWAIETETKKILLMHYDPKVCQPKKDIQFLSRGEPKSFSLKERLH